MAKLVDQGLAAAGALGQHIDRAFQQNKKLAANLATQGLRATAHQSAAEAVLGADIVTTITADKTNATIVTADMIAPGTHINAVGGDCPGKTELHADVLASARVFVEFEPQTRVEGDIQQLPADFPVVDLWRVLAGTAPGRQSAAQVTVFDSVGFALEDYSALCWVGETAAALGIGEAIDLVPQAADPKNLFGLLRAPGPAARRTAQALAAAAATIPGDRLPQSLHAYFIKGGRVGVDVDPQCVSEGAPGHVRIVPPRYAARGCKDPTAGRSRR